MEAYKPIRDVHLPNEEGVDSSSHETKPPILPSPEQKLARGALADVLWQRVTTQMLTEAETTRNGSHPSKMRNYL